MINEFPEALIEIDPDRSKKLLGRYYQNHHQNRSYNNAKDDAKKADFFNHAIEIKFLKSDHVCGLDLGCRGGALTEMVKGVAWHGIDVDPKAVEVAKRRGIPCREADFSLGLDLKSSAFDVVMMTEVLEHLPFPPITISEVHRVLKQNGLFFGTVPLDYHLHRRWRVMRGMRLEADPTHIHSFSYTELDEMLHHFFDAVIYKPMRGTCVRYPWLPYRHFVSDIAWIASTPKKNLLPWEIKLRK